MAKKVFITGIAGNLGQNLARILTKKGYQVVGNDVVSRQKVNFVLDLEKIKYLWKATQDLKKEDLKGTNIVVSCASQADRPLGISSPIYTIHTNLIPLTRLLEICRGIKLEKFLHMGSGTIYLGLANDQLPATEETVPRPTNPYSVSKYCQDILCQGYWRCYDLPVVILRSGMVVGVPMRLDISISIWIMRALKGEPLEVFNPDTTRTPTDARDVLKFWEKIIEAKPDKVVGRVFHTVYPTSKEQKGEYRIIKMARMVKKITNSSSKIIVTKPEPGELVGGKPAKEWIISTTAKELGVKPEFTLEDSIKEITAWIKDDVLK